MRTFGQIKPGFWIHQKVKGVLTDAEKLLFVYLISCEHSNAIGCYRLPFGYVSEDLDWSVDKVSETVSELSRKGFVRVCEPSQYVLIRDFLEHQPITNPNIGRHCAKLVAGLPKTFSLSRQLIEELGKSEFLQDASEAVAKQFSNGSERLSEPYRTPKPKPEPKPVNKISVDEASTTTQECSKPKTRGDPLKTEFEIWWKDVPKAVGKLDALKAYRAARKKASAEDLLDGIRRYAAEVAGKDSEFVKHPGPWLRAGRWMDEAPAAPDPGYDTEKWRRRVDWFVNGWPASLVRDGKVASAEYEWPAEDGPPPGTPGCFVPKEILTEMGFTDG